jgi:N utilization substance protein B
MGNRRRARSLALQILYQLDITNKSPDQDIQLFWELHPADQEITDYANILVNGTLKHLEYLDSLIQKYSLHWDITRMTIVDRNILRFALFELLYIRDAPLKVIINEAIEIAKLFSTDDSGRFINGILDKIVKDAIPETQKDDLL